VFAGGGVGVGAAVGSDVGFAAGGGVLLLVPVPLAELPPEPDSLPADGDGFGLVLA
jgi:hypothetical protein